MCAHAKRLGLVVAMLGFLGVATTAQAGTRLYSGSLIIEAFGNDYGTYFYGVPLGAHCNTMVDKGTFCGSATFQQGAPLTGTGTAGTDGMGGFTLLASDLARSTSGSFAYYIPYIRSYTYADLKNQAGSFFAGGGPGSFSFPYYTYFGSRVAGVAAKKGPNQFGGTMQLLGDVRGKSVYLRAGGKSYGSLDWRFDILGASAMGTAKATFYNTLHGPIVNYAVGTAFPWTTGTVTATALGRPPAYNFERRKGYDNRTSMGQGTIQLVSPLLTHWLAPPLGGSDTVGIGVLRIVFANDSDGDGVPDAEDECPGSNLEPAVVIDGCDSGVSNTLLSDGCTISDRIDECADNTKNHGQFQRCVSKLGDSLQTDGVLTGREKDQIVHCGRKTGRKGPPRR